MSKEVRKQVEEDEEVPEKTYDEDGNEIDTEKEEVVDEGEKAEGEGAEKEKKTKTVTEQVWEWETIN